MSTNKENTDVTTASPPLSPSFLFLYISLGLLAATYTMFNIFPDLKGMTLLSWNGVFKIILVVLAIMQKLPGKKKNSSKKRKKISKNK